MQGYLAAQAEAGIGGIWPYEQRLPELRSAVAAFVGAHPGEIAFVESTTAGATIVAAGLPWEPGDEVIVGDDEFPANVHPWLALRARGVVVRFVETARGPLTPDALRALITPRTRVVAVSWVGFVDGYRHDLEGLAEVAHAAGALLCVDAMQGLGVLALDLGRTPVDVLYAGARKWLLGLAGSGLLYVRAPALERIALALPGWRSVADKWDYLAYAQRPAAGAERFEAGTPNVAGALALVTSLALLRDAGVAAIERHVLALTDELVAALDRLGARVVTRRGARERSAIVTFALPGRDPDATVRRLGEAGIAVTRGPAGIRVSPHGYNTRDELERLVAELADSPAGESA